MYLQMSMWFSGREVLYGWKGLVIESSKTFFWFFGFLEPINKDVHLNTAIYVNGSSNPQRRIFSRTVAYKISYQIGIENKTP